MKGYVANIDQETVKNGNFRKVLFTSKHHQLVVMSLKPGEDIGMEKHDVDQFIRVEKGHGLVEMDGTTSPIQEDSAVIVPAGARHNVRNTSGESDLKIYTVYSSPQHEDGAVHKTKAEAEEEEE